MARYRTLISWFAASIALLVCLSINARAEAPRSSDYLRQCEYGITLVIGGNFSRADSIFEALRALFPRDARVLNSLGNVNLLQNRVTEALAYYDLAVSADSMDAGIHLNRAIALWVAGRTEEAIRERELAKSLSGVDNPVERLLGLRSPETSIGELESRVGGGAVTPGRAKSLGVKPTDRRLSEGGIREMLKHAANSVPKSERAHPENGSRVRSRAVGAYSDAGAGGQPGIVHPEPYIPSRIKGGKISTGEPTLKGSPGEPSSGLARHASLADSAQRNLRPHPVAPTREKPMPIKEPPAKATPEPYTPAVVRGSKITRQEPAQRTLEGARADKEKQNVERVPTKGAARPGPHGGVVVRGGRATTKLPAQSPPGRPRVEGKKKSTALPPLYWKN